MPFDLVIPSTAWALGAMLATPTATLAGEVGRAFEECSHPHSFESDVDLKTAVHVVVHRFKCDGMSPEAALIALKQAIEAQHPLNSPLSLAYPDAANNGEECNATYDTVFRYFLEAYFADPV